MPVIRRYALKLDSMGNVLETINLQNVTVKEKEEILAVVFSQAMKRMGYSPAENDASVTCLSKE